MFGSRLGSLLFGVGRSNGAISGSIKYKMAADGHLGITALSRVTLASAGLSCRVRLRVRLQRIFATAALGCSGP